jgi:hypothetical protein
MRPVDFPQVALHAITHDCIADLARYGKTNLPPLTISPGRITDKCAPHPFLPVLVNREVVISSGETFLSRILGFARHNRLITLTLRGKPLTALLAAAADHITSTDGRHPRKKPMVAFSLDIGRLKCTLHCSLLNMTNRTTPRRYMSPESGRKAIPRNLSARTGATHDPASCRPHSNKTQNGSFENSVFRKCPIGRREV